MEDKNIGTVVEKLLKLISESDVETDQFGNLAALVSATSEFIKVCSDL